MTKLFVKIRNGSMYRLNLNIRYGKFCFTHCILLTAALFISLCMPAFAAGNTSACKNSIAIAPDPNQNTGLSASQFHNAENIDLKDYAHKIHKIRINIRKSACVNTRKIYLDDISEIKTPDSIPDFIKKRLGKIDMGFAPRPGQFKIFNGERLKATLNSEKLLPQDTFILIPDRVCIKRKSQEISRKRLKKIFFHYISERTEHREFTINNFSVRGLKVYPGGKLSLSLCGADNDKDIRGRVTLYLGVRINNKNYGRVTLSGWVDIFDTVLCASRPLERGTLLSSKDVSLEKKSISDFSGDYFTNPAGIQGKILKTGVSRGRCITENMVGFPPLVYRGEVIKMVAAAGDLRIVTSGIAKSDGKLNDQIRVENISSKRIVYGIVTGKSTVNVLY